MTTRPHTSRVSAGEFHYKIINQPVSGTTRPVSQKLRAAIFDTLGHDLTELNVLDLYSGSGALAIEALSRGAVSAVTVEQDKQAIAAIRANEREMGTSLGLKEESVEDFLEAVTAHYDVIFMDPPYALYSDRIAERAAKLLTAGGVLVVSCAASQVLPKQLGTASMVKARTYDDTQLAYYKNA